MSVSMEITGAAELNPVHLVFINHRGPDCKYTFVSHLYERLKTLGFRPFLDKYDIPPGSDVVESITQALKGACVHVAIFSQRYAESEHCLSELCDMLDTGKKILPVFYHVRPKDLCSIEGGPYAESFRKHRERGRGNQVEKWKYALAEISKRWGFVLSREITQMNWDEAQVIKSIIDEVQVERDRHQSGYMCESSQNSDQYVPNGTVADPPLQPQRVSHPLPEVQTRDRQLNILVLGDPDSVKATISLVCGADCEVNRIEDCQDLTKNSNALPPICLYSDTKAIYKKRLKIIKAFVEARNKKWYQKKGEASRVCEEDYSNPRKWTSLRPELRLHMLWFVCKKSEDLPDALKWPDIMKLYGLPVQILVIHSDSTTVQDFNMIFERGSEWFPNAQNVEELIVDVALKDEDMKKKLWEKCLGAKTRAEICVVSQIISEIRYKLGSKGKSSPVGLGSGAFITKEVSLKRGGAFVLNFVCRYWNIEQDEILGVLAEKTSKHPLAKQINIKSFGFVKYCLTVAAMILYDAQDSTGDSTGGPKYVSNWKSSIDSSRHSHYYDKMNFEDIRGFLQSAFERKDPMLYVHSIDKTNQGHKWSYAGHSSASVSSFFNWCRTVQTRL